MNAFMAVLFCIVIGCTTIAVVTIQRVDSAAIPDVLRELTTLLSILLGRHPHQ
ncbi:hypothetical protein [Streptomyces corynorhini]|uniref:hypothetical protein n=1 Tax=Streptomyces corynorhini TaxID=2282652 RepID=UPI001314E148|nr:hypothetical protein [Streptomyces corynorhini]